MTYRLYNRVRSAGFSIEAVLTLAEIPFELVEIDSQAGSPLPESFRKTNPWRQVPVLILPDGEILTESAAILIYLASAHPETAPGLVSGSADHAKFLRWIVFASVNVHESYSHVFYPSRFTTDEHSLEATQAAARLRLQQAMEVLDRALTPGPFLLGQHMTSVDIYLAMLFAWCRIEIDAPNLARVLDRVRQHPIIAPIWLRHVG